MAKKNIFRFKINTSIRDHIIQAILIFASVYFAFYINKQSDNHKINKRKAYALESIKKELKQNSEVIDIWHENHLQIYNRIEDMAEGRNDSLKTELLKLDFLNMGVLTNNESLVNEILTNTAWKTAMATGIISEFDFETIQTLTYVYSMQEVLMDKTITKILDFYFDMEAHNMENLNSILIQYQLRFGELTGQEYLLKYLYADALNSLENKRN